MKTLKKLLLNLLLIIIITVIAIPTVWYVAGSNHCTYRGDSTSTKLFGRVYLVHVCPKPKGYDESSDMEGKLVL